MSPRKKEVTVTLSPEETTQVQNLFAQYHQLAQHLRESTQQSAAEAVLAPIHQLSAEAQLSLLTSLAKEHNVDAADILAAENAFNPQKEVRKEARRALIRLDAAKVISQWQPPVVHTSAIEVKVPNPPRFWKGWVTQTREEGEVALMLCWEQGYDYSEARMLSLQLDFWNDGIKDCTVETNTKRHIDEDQKEWRAALSRVPIVDCTPAEARNLIENALGVNEWRKRTPHQAYRNNLPLITKLLQIDSTSEGAARPVIDPELEPAEVAINFIGAWTMGDYGLAYDLLTAKSPIREGLERDEWVSRRRAWADESNPDRLELGFVHEQEPKQSALWLPSSSSRVTTNKEVELGWSLELLETQLSGTLKEMPMGTAINKDTGRHWFWTSYTIVRENNAWRIQNITDEGARAQGLAIAELQKRVKEQVETVENLMKQEHADTQSVLEEASWRLTHMLHYYDALLALLPLDYQVNEEAYGRSIVAANPERTLVYLERLVQRFPDNHVEALRRLGSTLTTLAYKYDDIESNAELQARQQHLLARAEQTLKEAIEAEHSALNYTLLAELYLSQERNDDAEAQLLQGKTATPNAEEEATIEAALGNIAMRREQIAEALPHYQRVSELNANYPGIWFNLGFANRMLGNFSQAEIYYQRAIETTPTDERPFAELIAIAMNQQDKPRAKQIAEQSVRLNPESASLKALLASVLQEMGDIRGAQRQLAEAEAIDSSLDIVQSVRQHLTAKKKER